MSDTYETASAYRCIGSYHLRLRGLFVLEPPRTQSWITCRVNVRSVAYFVLDQLLQPAHQIATSQAWRRHLSCHGVSTLACSRVCYGGRCSKLWVHLCPGSCPAGLVNAHAAVLHMRVLVFAGLHLSNFVPEGYAYTGHSSQPEALASVVRKQESRLPASLPVRSTGYTAFLDEHVVKQGAGQRQRSADKQHNTLMFTREGHLYTKP